MLRSTRDLKRCTSIVARQIWFLPKIEQPDPADSNAANAVSTTPPAPDGKPVALKLRRWVGPAARHAAGIVQRSAHD